MIIKSVNLETVCGVTSRLPENDKPEIAFAGKSNVGKSSLINALMNRKAYARTSAQPGKTQTINFYNINDALYYVDLPGYGYAKVSKSLSKDWGPMMERYLESRKNLVKVIQLVDIRHQPSKQDVQMYEYLKYHGLAGIVVATKSDKISRNEAAKTSAVIRRTLGMKPEEPLIAVSSLKKTGYDRLIDEIENLVEAWREEHPDIYAQTRNG